MRLLQSLLSLGLVVGLLGMAGSNVACRSQEKVDGVKQAAQFPAAELAWPGVRGDYLHGIVDGESEGDLLPGAANSLRAQGDALGAALAAKDSAALRGVPWSTVMRPWADRGIQTKLGEGMIGPTVADELTERAINFTATIVSLQGTDL